MVGSSLLWIISPHSAVSEEQDDQPHYRSELNTVLWTHIALLRSANGHEIGLGARHPMGIHSLFIGCGFSSRNLG